MGYIDIYKNRISSYGSTSSDALKNNTINIINQTFRNSPFYMELNINEVLTPCRLVETSKNNIKNILLLPGNNVPVGTIISINSVDWLVLEVFDNDVFPKLIIQKCNLTLKWNDGTSDIEQSCVITDIERTGRIEEEKFIFLPSGRFNIILNSNVNTVKIKRDMRFLFNDSAWKCIFVNKLLDGIIKITVDEDIIKHSDDFDKGVSDNESGSGGGFW